MEESAEIARRGFLEPKRLASMSMAGLIELLDSLPIRPRWGAQEGAKTLSGAEQLVCDQFAGDTGAIWTDSSPARGQRSLQQIHRSASARSACGSCGSATRRWCCSAETSATRFSRAWSG